VLICSSTILAIMLRSALPEHHLSSDSKEVMRLATEGRHLARARHHFHQNALSLAVEFR
jgi:hypothetical protein